MIIEATPRVRALRFTKDVQSEVEKLVGHAIRFEENRGEIVGYIDTMFHTKCVCEGEWIVRHGADIFILSDDVFYTLYRVGG